jgi:organic radical activating enzyme
MAAGLVLANIYTMTRSVLPFVEIMITQACNLSCQGCTNYSDLRHSGYVTWAQGQQWFDAWKHRIKLPDIGIMGGEPLINPEWRSWLYGLRSMFPNSQLRFTTNGLLLSKCPDIMDVMFDVGNVVFKITVHVQNDDTEQWIKQCRQNYQWQPVVEFGIQRLRSRRAVRFQVNRPEAFLPVFRNSYADMAPWHSDPEQAFAQCIQKTCPLMYKGRIYKCSTTALLADTLDRFDRPNWPQWQEYITQGIGVDDSDEVLNKFVANFGHAESVCAQCPDHAVSTIDHKLTVRLQKP